MAQNGPARERYIAPFALLFLVTFHAQTLSAQTTKYTVSGTASAANYGSALASVGDVDGDGITDFAVGAPTTSSTIGVVQVLSGASGAALYSISGIQPLDKFGYALATTDINNDGITDLIVGAPAEVEIAPGYPPYYHSYVRVLEGPTFAQVLREVYGAARGAEFGMSIAGISDANADGYNDFIVAEPRSWCYTDCNNSRRARGYLYSGYNGDQPLRTFDPQYYVVPAGIAVLSPGDLNADRIPDIVLAHLNRIDAFSGATGALLYSRSVPLASDSHVWLTELEDVSGDGVPDYASGHPYGGLMNSGQVNILSGTDGSILRTFYGDREYDLFGYAVTIAGDLDGDGWADLITIAVQHPTNPPPGYVPRPGYVRALSAKTGRVLGTLRLTSADLRPYAIASLGDIDEDGRADFVLGAPETAPYGRVYVIGFEQFTRPSSVIWEPVRMLLFQ